MSSAAPGGEEEEEETATETATAMAVAPCNDREQPPSTAPAASGGSDGGGASTPGGSSPGRSGRSGGRKPRKTGGSGVGQRERDEAVLRKLAAYPRHDDILNEPYRLLSSTHRSPAATLIGRGGGDGSSSRRLDARAGGGPGPGSYETLRPWSQRGAPRIVPATARSLKPPAEDTLSALELPSSLSPSPRHRRGFSMSFRLAEAAGARQQAPGPTTYTLPSFTDKYTSAAAPAARGGGGGGGGGASTPRDDRCTFGVPHPPERPNTNPGPGTYESSVPKVGPGTCPLPRTTRVRPRPKPPAAKPSPGPGAYTVGRGAFDHHHGALATTIKGRLPHPMLDHNAVHECARTSAPRNFQRRMRAVPRLK